MFHELPGGPREAAAEPGAQALEPAARGPRGGRLLQPRLDLARHPRLRRGDRRISTQAARSATSTTSSRGTRTSAAGRRASRSITAAGPTRPRSPPRPSPHAAARCRTAASARCIVLGVCTPAAATRDPWPALDEARDIAVRADRARTPRCRLPSRAPRRAGWRATTTGSRRRPTCALARAEASDARWTIGELAIWRHRAGLPPTRPAARPPYEAEIAGDAARGSGLLGRPRLPLRRRARARHPRRRRRPAREPARAAEPRRAARRGDRRAAPARARRPRRAARAPGHDAGEPGRPHCRASSTCSRCSARRPQRRHRREAVPLREDRRPPRVGDPAQARRAQRGQAAAEAARLGIGKIGRSPEVAAGRRRVSVAP